MPNFEHTIQLIGDDLWKVEGPALDQPMHVTGEEYAERMARRLSTGERQPAKGRAHFRAELEIT